ncbi:MAG TPA: universal stress protein [Lunatimonas sp.]|nr:universal stress protein [Lunatimonas sp.]
MKKLLVPTDFSPHADLALDYAVEMAEKNKLEIDLLHVLLTPINWLKLEKTQENLYPEIQQSIRIAKSNLSDRVKKAKEIGVMINSHLHFSQGKDQILPFAAREGADMIVMGSHGSYGWKEHMLGSNTYHVLRKSPIPVLVVKPNENASVQLKTVVFATDFSEASGKAFGRILAFVYTFKAKLSLLYVNTPANFLEESQMEELGNAFLEKYADKAYPIHYYSAYKEERGILQFTEKTKADAVAVVTHGRSDLQQLFLPSVTENLVTYLKVPVFAINLTVLKKEA